MTRRIRSLGAFFHSLISAERHQDLNLLDLHSSDSGRSAAFQWTMLAAVIAVHSVILGYLFGFGSSPANDGEAAPPAMKVSFVNLADEALVKSDRADLHTPQQAVDDHHERGVQRPAQATPPRKKRDGAFDMAQALPEDGAIKPDRKNTRPRSLPARRRNNPADDVSTVTILAEVISITQDTKEDAERVSPHAETTTPSEADKPSRPLRETPVREASKRLAAPLIDTSVPQSVQRPAAEISEPRLAVLKESPKQAKEQVWEAVAEVQTQTKEDALPVSADEPSTEQDVAVLTAVTRHRQTSWPEDAAQDIRAPISAAPLTERIVPAPDRSLRLESETGPSIAALSAPVPVRRRFHAETTGSSERSNLISKAETIRLARLSERQERLDAYRNIIRSHLARHKPPGGFGEDKVLVGFTLTRSGEVISARILRSRGIYHLEQGTLNAVHRAVPYPTPPNSLEGSHFHFAIPFHYQ